jgi:serine protease Do
LLERFVLPALLIAAAWPAPAADAPARPLIQDTLARTQPKIVKIYGAGGLRGLEAYQTGCLISAEGHVLTVWSYVLDTEYINVVLNDGRKYAAKLLGADPRIEIALLKIDATDLPHFDLKQAVEAEPGTRVLALSNLFNVAVGDEPASVQHGTVAVKTRLEARRGTFETPYGGPVYVLDVVTNNPGAGGGALVTWRGEILGVLGKELRNSLNNTWLSYALPIAELRDSIDQIRAGKVLVRKPDEESKKPAKGLTPAALGLVLVPDVLERTPPFIDQVRPGSAAEKAGLVPDDLVLMVGDRLIQSCKALRTELQYVDHEDKVKLTVLRAQQMLEFVLQAGAEEK